MVDHPDLIVMDGVVHKIDSVLLPPLPLSAEESNSSNEEASQGRAGGNGGIDLSTFVAWLWSWSRLYRSSREIEVLELMDRLQPYLVDGRCLKGR